MAISTGQILNVLQQYGIRPLDDDYAEIELPGIGEIGSNETVYTTSLDNVFGRGDRQEEMLSSETEIEEPRISAWREELEVIIGNGSRRALRQAQPPHPPEPYCAWYCPVHFYGYEWGIYIRERCILSLTLDIARFVNWRFVTLSPREIWKHLQRSAFYVFFLHEQFHHKVESLGFRLLISTGTDCYRPYKTNVYRRTFNTDDCIEESLANAESHRRLSELRYRNKIDPAIREGLRDYLEWSIPLQPPGYSNGMDFLSEAPYRKGLYQLQSQVLDGAIPPSTRPDNWSVAPNMITSLADIANNIYVILPGGSRPLFRPTIIDPGATTSTRALVAALTRYYGYAAVKGGKGSHVKLSKPGAPTLILRGNQATLSPGLVKQVLAALGGHPISRLPDLLEGRLA